MPFSMSKNPITVCLRYRFQSPLTCKAALDESWSQLAGRFRTLTKRKGWELHAAILLPWGFETLVSLPTLSDLEIARWEHVELWDFERIGTAHHYATVYREILRRPVNHKLAVRVQDYHWSSCYVARGQDENLPLSPAIGFDQELPTSRWGELVWLNGISIEQLAHHA